MPEELTDTAFAVEGYQADDAFQRVRAFGRRFGPDHIALAMHAALPIGLTPDIVHLIRINFVPSAPWIAEADLLLSPLCREAGRDLYEMDAGVRDLLLDELNADEDFGPPTIRSIAEFLLAYSSRVLRLGDHKYLQDFLKAQQWTAIAYVDPEEASCSLVHALKRGMESRDRGEVLRVANVTQSLSGPLFSKQKVLLYAAGVKRLIQREHERAFRMFDALGPTDQPLTISDISLPAPSELTELLDVPGATRARRVAPPKGLRLRAVLQEKNLPISDMAWSPDGASLASVSKYGEITIWSVKNRTSGMTFTGSARGSDRIAWSPDGGSLTFISFDTRLLVADLQHSEVAATLAQLHGVRSFAWSPNGRILASGSAAGELQLWQLDTFGKGGFKALRALHITRDDIDALVALAWSPNSRNIACVSASGSLSICNVETGIETKRTENSEEQITSIVWGSDSRSLICGSPEGHLFSFNVGSGKQMWRRTPHTHSITALSFSSDGRLLASRSSNGTIRLWRTDDWEVVASLEDTASGPVGHAMAFHPKEPRLATLDETGTAIHIWSLDLEVLLKAEPPPAMEVEPPPLTTRYRNARVVLLGDPGSGKSSLARALSGQPFEPTESTHGLRVNAFDRREVELDDGQKEIREIFLWDLAGQPFYRLITPLNLTDASLVLIVFSQRDSNRFTSMRYWGGVVYQAGRESALPITSFLVEARADLTIEPASTQREIRDLGVDIYFQTSAKSGEGIPELIEAIKTAIDWNALPALRSAQVYDEIQDFVRSQKEAGRMIISAESLYHDYSASRNAIIEVEDFRPQFNLCIGRLETSGQVRRSKLNDSILLRPEMLDSLIASLFEMARANPDGLGEIPEQQALSGGVLVLKKGSEENLREDQLILTEAIETLIHHELALREEDTAGNVLVFPSQVTREIPEPPNLKGKTISITFEGNELNLYSTLVVRLSLSDDFEKEELWKNTAIFRARAGGTCGIILGETKTESGELILFFDQDANAATREQFERFAHDHLLSRVRSKTVKMRRIFTCPSCASRIMDDLISAARERNLKAVTCPVCDAEVFLLDGEEPSAESNESA